MTGKEQIIIDINKYFVELIDKGGGTVGYTVMFPERLLIEIIKQNKQLARKTQEYEELKERIKCNCFDPKSNNNRCISYNRIVEDYKRDLKRLENKIAECEELKDYAKRQENQRETYYKEFLKKDKALERYRKALEEIEEIAKSFNKNELCFYNEINECDCCDMGADCNYLRRAKILYIINKAKGEGNGINDNSK